MTDPEPGRVQKLINDQANRIIVEFAARATAGASLSSNAAVEWLKLELTCFGVAIVRGVGGR